MGLMVNYYATPSFSRQVKCSMSTWHTRQHTIQLIGRHLYQLRTKMVTLYHDLLSEEMMHKYFNQHS